MQQDTSSLLPPLPPGAQQLPLQQQQTQICGDGAAANPLGWPAQKSWYVLVTYPSCDLITMVALPSGRIVSSAYVRATTDSNGNKSVTLVERAFPGLLQRSLRRAGADPVVRRHLGRRARTDAAPTVDAHAPAQPEAGVSDGATIASDAGGGAAGMPGSTGAGATPGAGGTPGSAGASGSADAGATGGSPGGATLGNQYPDDPYVGPGPIGPSGIAILPDASRAYVSLANASFVVSVGLSSSGLTFPAKSIYLHEGARGSSRVRLNVQPNRYLTNPGIAGVFVGAETATATQGTVPDSGRKYLYAIARDGTVRVIQVAKAPETECETNANPLHLAPGSSATDACILVDPAHRRPFSIGPGIHFSSLPIDIAAADIENAPASTNEQTVNGAYAWVITDWGSSTW